MNRISKYTIAGVFIVAIMVRILSIDFSKLDKYVITNYDGLGYYIYLPAIFIYQDVTEYKWIDEIDAQYQVFRGDWKFQISQHKNGNFVTKYLGGTAIMQLPFFLVAHGYALVTDYPADGFSVPYQLALAFAPLFYFALVLLLLRKILLRYYEDEVVAVTLVLLFLASNAIQYISVDAGLSHGYLLLLYTLILQLSIKWHEEPSGRLALFTGLVIGLATISRPTELIILLIPLLWNTHNKESTKAKWTLVKDHKNYIALVVLGAFLGALPQMIYWMYVVGSPIQTIGSKWYFLNPYFRVLFGWQKGWFIYTPVTIFFVLGFFFMKDRPFKKSVLWFCLLNIWIIIAWSVWRYGGSYSTRALVQSYPVFALALAGLITWVFSTRFKVIFYIVALYLIGVNLFQVWQYKKGILRHDEMNRGYYQSVYLDMNPTALDMSMLDDGERMPIDCKTSTYFKNIVPKDVVDSEKPFYSVHIPENQWIDIELDLFSKKGFWRGYVVLLIKDKTGKEIGFRKFRMFNYLTKSTKINQYHMQVHTPKGTEKLEIKLGGGKNISAQVKSLIVKGCFE
ncbi:MAG: hypothetical protein AAGA77_02680 [Bacteroidota bacterium]